MKIPKVKDWDALMLLVLIPTTSVLCFFFGTIGVIPLALLGTARIIMILIQLAFGI